MEKLSSAPSGFKALLLALALPLVIVFLLVNSNGSLSGFYVVLLILVVLFDLFIINGITVVQPNYATVLTFFGKYVGTIKQNGLLFVNPLYKKTKVTLRTQSTESSKLKVNDKLGNPIEIAVVILWQISDTYKATFEVDNFREYVKNQSEAAVRHLATSYAYDNIESDHPQITLSGNSDQVTEMMEDELNNRLVNAGITIIEARISHLAYAPEIAGAMLQRQQATAIVAARSKIVEGAVGMVEMALDKLAERNIVKLDDEKKAAMVSNLMVVLCGEKSVSPMVNTGSL
ncbi:MAG: SPFH domain-containing protein [Chitinophagaceae bacterium]|jgi:regulator of protease activity HflC (stomatin/prohibitin superfamily)